MFVTDTIILRLNNHLFCGVQKESKEKGFYSSDSTQILEQVSLSFECYHFTTSLTPGCTWLESVSMQTTLYLLTLPVSSQFVISSPLHSHYSIVHSLHCHCYLPPFSLLPHPPSLTSSSLFLPCPPVNTTHMSFYQLPYKVSYRCMKAVLKGGGLMMC